MAMSGLAGVVTLVLSLTAQQAAVPRTRTIDIDQDAIKLHARLVNLNVKVRDQSGKPVPKLIREDFLVSENSILQEVTYFEPIAAPVNLLLLLDLSGSIG